MLWALIGKEVAHEPRRDIEDAGLADLNQGFEEAMRRGISVLVCRTNVRYHLCMTPSRALHAASGGAAREQRPEPAAWIDQDAPDVGGILHLLEGSVVTARRAEADKFQLVLAWAEAHRAIPIGGTRFVLNHAGADGVAHEVEERDTIRVGATRTRLYRYAMDELAISLQVSSHTASRYVSNAVDCAYRLPAIYDAVVAGRIDVWVARKLVAMTADLSPEGVAEVDATLAPHLGALPIGRLVTVAESAVASADPDAQAAKFEEERNRRLMHLSRVKDGHRTLFIRTDAVSAARFFETASELAERLADAEAPGPNGPSNMDELRAASVALLADPQGAVDFLAGKDPRRGKAVVYVHTTAEQLTELTGVPIARVEEIGPACHELMREFIGHDHISLAPVIDLNDEPAPADAYEIPAAVAQRVHLFDPADTFPYSNTVSRRVDLDHTIPYAAGVLGQTRVDNLAPLTRRHHRVKTHARGWHVEHLGNRAYLWTTPHGRQVVVDRQGTHQVVSGVGIAPSSTSERWAALKACLPLGVPQ